MFNGIKLTTSGAEMLAAAQIGGTLRFSRVQIGSGLLPTGTDESALTALVTPVSYFPISEVNNKENVVSVVFQVLNRDMTEEFAFREIGLYAIDSNGAERLYAYTNAGENAETIPLPSVTTIDYIISLEMAVSGTESGITVVIDDTLTFATKEDFENAVKKTDVIDIAHGGTGATDAATARTNLGAASNDHSHDLNSASVTGVLPISKGGTGATTQEEARKALGIAHSTIDGIAPIAKGGTGASTPGDALKNLGVNIEAINPYGDALTERGATESGKYSSYLLFTAPASGAYLLGARAVFDSSTTGIRKLQFADETGETIYSSVTQRAAGDAPHEAQCVTALWLNEGDDIYVRYYQSSGYNKNVSTAHWVVRLT